MKKPKQPLIPEKTKQELFEVLDSIDPERADSALRSLIDETLRMLQELSQKKPCSEKTALMVCKSHEKLLRQQFNKLFPEKPRGIGQVLKKAVESMNHVLMMQKGKTWK